MGCYKLVPAAIVKEEIFRKSVLIRRFGPYRSFFLTVGLYVGGETDDSPNARELNMISFLNDRCRLGSGRSNSIWKSRISKKRLLFLEFYGMC